MERVGSPESLPAPVIDHRRSRQISPSPSLTKLNPISNQRASPVELGGEDTMPPFNEAD